MLTLFRDQLLMLTLVLRLAANVNPVQRPAANVILFRDQLLMLTLFRDQLVILTPVQRPAAAPRYGGGKLRAVAHVHD